MLVENDRDSEMRPIHDCNEVDRGERKRAEKFFVLFKNLCHVRYLQSSLERV